MTYIIYHYNTSITACNCLISVIILLIIIPKWISSNKKRDEEYVSMDDNEEKTGETTLYKSDTNNMSL